MTELVLNDASARDIERFTHNPSHALLLIAPTGAGKMATALYLASKLLGVPTEKLTEYPSCKIITARKGKSISVESVREIIHFMSLKATGAHDARRIVIIEHAQTMTVQAQNALLKTIEEPPEGAIFILTAASELGILPTILSRSQKLYLLPPTAQALTEYFQGEGYSEAAVAKALAMSGGLPGLMHALLEHDANHPLVIATAQAREILQKTMFERVLLVDSLAGDRESWLNTLFILGRMAQLALVKPMADVKRWHRILAACHEAERQSVASAQAKLVVLNFMLAL